MTANGQTHMRKPVALVTGASGGIGWELARQLAASDHDLVLVARSAETLDRAARELEREYHVRVESLREICPNPAKSRRSGAI
jgi:short-subunit dehydrogenase